MPIGDKIKYLRELKGISQQELANFLDIKQQSINAWEHSVSNPRKKNIEKLANFFHVDAGFFFSDSFDIKKKNESKSEKENLFNTSVHQSATIQPHLINTENYLVEVSPEEFKLLNKLRLLPEKAKIRIEARIEAEYDIMKEVEYENTRDA